ncbi:Anaphase-promoting complex subunit 5 [Orchesella cincta]|uniref:Anaphase-promoting complex subunit 5 n=1 Tax=Orchesella cincta TaxID=48709 RepID=A0A1D2NA51_ORCCI|nr:Anaphase-promoting complex subunit 5 [Orchesella cincta]
MGYKKDTLLCLEEAFRAGHSAADATCLHYCHNMWSSLQNKPYTDAIVTVTKEVDNNMAYLHSLNVISNAFDYHYQRQPPEEVLYTLWHYNAECDLEEMESLLLLSLAGFFMSFGWHEMVSFPCQIILYSKLKWPLKAYCKALCILADSLLIRGETDIPCAIMEYGESLFGYDASAVGQMFCLRHATFKAFYAYLGYKPVPDSVIATLHSYNKIEGFYWQAYSRMVGNEWEQASNLLTSLSKLLKEGEISCENNDMKIRCLLLMAELQCLSGAPASALGYIYEALEIAYSFSADHHVTLCLSHIASIQCELGLATAASKTIHKEMRSVVRSSNPWSKISLRLHETIPKLCEQQLMKKLTASEELYKKWNNAYRLKEVYHLKAELLDKSEDIQLNGNSYRKLLESMESYLVWSPSTCLL